MMSHASETTETSLLVILAYIRLIIPSHCCSEIRWCSNWSLAHHSTRCISSCGIFLFIVLCIIVQAPINLVIFFSLQFLVRNRDTIFLNNKIQKNSVNILDKFFIQNIPRLFSEPSQILPVHPYLSLSPSEEQLSLPGHSGQMVELSYCFYMIQLSSHPHYYHHCHNWSSSDSSLHLSTEIEIKLFLYRCTRILYGTQLQNY